MAESQQTPATTPVQNPAVPLGNFPPNEAEKKRLEHYGYHEKLFYGDHYGAFNLKINSKEFNSAYSQLRYVMVNFAGLVSKICADMLFGDPVSIKTEEGDLDFIEGLWNDNQMDTKAYESELSNSYEGDACFKVRVGKRYPGDKKDSVIIEGFTPRIYFPQIDQFNVTAPPKEVWLQWTFDYGKDKYLRREIHTIGKIENKVFMMKGEEIEKEVTLVSVGLSDIKESENTSIDRLTVVHIPNWRTNNRHYGISDYFDLDSLFFAINNRLTKVDNILDKHSDPILIVPPGVLDENGKPKKSDGRVVELGEDSGDGKPEYVVWDASLENAFKELEQLVQMLEMTAEVSPDVFGMGKGANDSGRALKYKLMRTIAKVGRKKLYYKPGLEEVLYVAQLLAKQGKVENRDGSTLTKEPVYPDLEFADGLPKDMGEQIETETAAIDAKVTSTRDAIMRIYGVDEAEAEKRVKKIDEDTKLAMPEMGLGGNPFNKKPGTPTPKPAGK